jgi:hypothetical protein
MSRSTELTKEREVAMKKNWPTRVKERVAEYKLEKAKNRKIHRAQVAKAAERAKAKRRAAS